MVTHDRVAASYADPALFLADGHIVDDMIAPQRDVRDGADNHSPANGPPHPAPTLGGRT
jgi:hypothetical protein